MKTNKFVKLSYLYHCSFWIRSILHSIIKGVLSQRTTLFPLEIGVDCEIADQDPHCFIHMMNLF